MTAKDWHAFIHDPALAGAIMDRLIHSSRKLVLNGDFLHKVKAIKSRE
ncbi:ATP-binding protein [Stenotrophomonas sp. GD03777]|nr:ATP-binding protein [Stenotrophomonas sp. GD03777]MDH1660925.1 ATP-binding protein [Stenotrophomonas sp. GD03777]